MKYRNCWLAGCCLVAFLSLSATAQTMVGLAYRGSGAWALADSGDYFVKNENTTEHVWEHWGNVFEVAGVAPEGRTFVGMAQWGGSSEQLCALCGNGDVFTKDGSTEPGVGWSYVTNLFDATGHGIPGETTILDVESYAATYIQVLCYNGEWYKSTGDPYHPDEWEYVGNIFEMAGFDPIAAQNDNLSEVRSLFR